MNFALIFIFFLFPLCAMEEKARTPADFFKPHISDAYADIPFTKYIAFLYLNFQEQHKNLNEPLLEYFACYKNLWIFITQEMDNKNARVILLDTIFEEGVDPQCITKYEKNLRFCLLREHIKKQELQHNYATQNIMLDQCTRWDKKAQKCSTALSEGLWQDLKNVLSFG